MSLRLSWSNCRFRHAESLCPWKRRNAAHITDHPANWGILPSSRRPGSLWSEVTSHSYWGQSPALTGGQSENTCLKCSNSQWIINRQMVIDNKSGNLTEIWSAQWVASHSSGQWGRHTFEFKGRPSQWVLSGLSLLLDLLSLYIPNLLTLMLIFEARWKLISRCPVWLIQCNTIQSDFYSTLPHEDLPSVPCI